VIPPQNGGRIPTTDNVTSLHPMYSFIVLIYRQLIWTVQSTIYIRSEENLIHQLDRVSIDNEIPTLFLHEYTVSQSTSHL